MRRLAFWGVGVGVVAVLLVAGVALYAWATEGLPDAKQLAAYAAPIPSTVRATDGSVLTSFTREKRIYLTYNEIPQQLVRAYISAEDKSFFEHGGLDYGGIVRAVWTNLGSLGTDKRPVGASTITQQLAKNLLQNSKVSISRKLKEAVLARRIEAAFTKQQILELYLNQIFLGRNAYGVEAAAQAYFGKSVADLDLPAMAYLAILPKAPSTYNPVTNRDRALARRNYVLRQMAANGYITPAQAAEATAAPLVAIAAHAPPPTRTGDYFTEDVRRDLIARYGETPADGPNSVYGGGLWVRTSIDPGMQAAAEKALRDGLVRFDRGRGWRGPSTKIAPGDGWPDRLRAVNLGTGYADWYPAMVLSNDGGSIRIGFTDGSEGVMAASNALQQLRGVGTPAAQLLRAGDVVPVAKAAGGYALRQIPEVSGGMVVEDPHTGRVLAMVGGFDARSSSFNRATQALRQPGSTIKPIVYATAMDNGFTPSSIVVDAPYCVYQTKRLGQKCFKNFSGGYAGAQTLRWGLEQSRNLMTVRVAFNTGMDKIVQQIKAFGIGDYAPVLAISIGAGDTTVLRMVNAFAQLFDAGRAHTPTLIDMVQDRDGRILFRADNRACENCNAPDWNGEPMPHPGGVPKQVIDARTAYQAVHLMEGVVTRGTAVRLADLNRPLAGKTGTNNGPTSVWFIGGTPDLVAGLYIGYDKPRNLGSGVQGGNTPVPVYKDFAEKILKDAPKLPFVIPPGIRMVRVDRRSGKRVFGVWPTDEAKAAVIWEAFKPESEPRRTGVVSGETGGGPTHRAIHSDADFLRETGGIY